MVRIVTCLASLCIVCALNGASLATPAPYSVAAARGGHTKQANRDHYRYKKYYESGQRLNDTAQSESTQSQHAELPDEETRSQCEPERVPFHYAPPVVAPTLQL